jgi:acyl-coenzyme A synthetase/AMP-(fatty) acid ligase/aryl carrier-like protein
MVIKYIWHYSIDFLLCVPSFYKMILQKQLPLASLKHVILGGENISHFILDQHARLAPHAFLYNEYGPTEAGICTTAATIYDPVERRLQRISAGKPLANIHVFILDQNLCFLPSGQKGEICIGGQGLARGYLNNPTLTSERFLSIVLPDASTIRVYKTGDVGRFLPNGDLEFLGRIDNQVKIRGCRIEIGEIESVLYQYPGLKEAVIVVRDNNLGDKELVACFSACTPINGQALRLFLTALLPVHMIPSYFIQLEHFPLTIHGKIDRTALLNLPQMKMDSTDLVPPQSALEQILLDIWKKILQCDVIGIHDNFFDIGGDSLSIMNVQASLAKVLNLEVSLITLFQYPTIFQLAQHLGRQEKTSLLPQNPLSKHQVTSEKRKAVLQQQQQTARFKKGRSDAKK